MATDETKGRVAGECDMCGLVFREIQRIGELKCCDDCLEYAYELVRPPDIESVVKGDRQTVADELESAKGALKNYWDDMHDLCAHKKHWRYREQLALIREMQNLIKAIEKWRGSRVETDPEKV